MMMSRTVSMMKHDLWSRGRFGFWIFGWPEGMGPTTARRVMGELRRPPAEWSEASRSSTTIGDQRTIGDQITDMERKRRSQRVFLASIDHVHRWAWVGGPCPWPVGAWAPSIGQVKQTIRALAGSSGWVSCGMADHRPLGTALSSAKTGTLL